MHLKNNYYNHLKLFHKRMIIPHYKELEWPLNILSWDIYLAIKNKYS